MRDVSHRNDEAITRFYVLVSPKRSSLLNQVSQGAYGLQGTLLMGHICPPHDVRELKEALRRQANQRGRRQRRELSSIGEH